MKKLIIAEKPSLAKTIVRGIGGNDNFKDFFENEKYIVTSQFGHLLELYSIGDYKNDKERDKKWTLDDLPYLPKEYKYKVKDDLGIKARYKLIKELIKRNDVNEIINAGDPDREGETLINIVIYKIFDELKINKKISRIWLDPLTEEKVQEELNNLKPIENTKNLYIEGKLRAILDWLYGINLTEYVSLKSGKTLNTGRVIIPLVKWIYDRDIEIENFKKEKYFVINSIIKKDNQETKINFKELKFDNINSAKDKAKELENQKIKVIKVESKEIEKKPKKLFSLSTLQTHLFTTNKFPINKTLSLVQSLYEKGFLTYPRTDTEYLSEEEKDKVRDIIVKQNNNDLEFKDSKTIFDSSKVESHTAIIITNKNPILDNLSKDEQITYLAVKNRFYANFTKEKCILNKTEVELNLKEYKTKLTGIAIKQIGYLKYENDLKENTILNFIAGEEYNTNLEIEEKETTPPSHLSESDLIKLCKNPLKKLDIEKEDFNDDEEYKEILNGSQIGTEATRAVMIEKIKKVGYVKEEKNKLLISDLGKIFIQNLEKLKINLWVDKTAEMNKDLKRVFKNEKSNFEVLKKSEDELKEIINQNINIEKVNINIDKNIMGKCPVCNNDVLESSKSYYCSNWKNGCSFTIWKTISDKKLTESNVKALLENRITKEIKGFKSKSGKLFNAKLKLNNDNKIEFEF